MFKNLWNQMLSWLVPTRIINMLTNVLALWRTANAKDRGILLVVFSPMLLCLAGMAFHLVSFVLFVLPSFVVKMFVWGAMVMLFSFVGNYGYGRLTGNGSSATGSWTWNWNGDNHGNNSNNSGNSNNDDFIFTDVTFTEDDTSAASDTGAKTRTRTRAKKTSARNSAEAQDSSQTQESTPESTPGQRWRERMKRNSQDPQE